VGLSLCVGCVTDLKVDDPEGAGVYSEYFSFVGHVMAGAGLPPHLEPSDCEVWSAQMFGYSGLHYLRRIAAHIDAALPLPPPGDDRSSSDPILESYFSNVIGKEPGVLLRLFKKQPRFARSFDHLIVHSDAEGFYVPQDFSEVLFADDRKLPGGMLGSVPRLLAELDRLANILGVPDDLHSEAEELWEAADSPGAGDALWQKYGIESFSCVVLREACHKSLATGAALVFC
jgi:hypothetical protein